MPKIAYQGVAAMPNAPKAEVTRANKRSRGKTLRAEQEPLGERKIHGRAGVLEQLD